MKKLIGKWIPSIKDDLHAWVVCGVLTKEQADKILKEFENEFNWKLVRERDGLTKQSKGIKWIEWNEDGTLNEAVEEAAVGRSLLMSPFTQSFTWQTTTISEIVEQRDDYIKFKTGNSTYELFKL